MSESEMKRHGRRISSYLLKHRLQTLNGEELRRSAIVFAPHQDDETLGCGGTILKKRRAGARVGIVFLTHGGRSHSHLMPEDELKRIRAREAVAASGVLGVDAREITFLEFSDSELEKHRGAATQKIEELLTRTQPEDVFVPYHQDGQRDHLSANRIVRAILPRLRNKPVLYEYPVWFWTHWPWANLPIGSRREILSVVKNAVLSSWRLLRDFRHAVYIGDVLDYKWNALNQYKSQMTQLIPEPRWATLGDVADGAFLKCFFQDYEVFYRYSDPE